ncbi:MAG: hypothetical protein RLZZ183_836 [Actinomycetota bacterium]
MKFPFVILISLILAACSNGEVEQTTFDNFMDEVAKLVEESTKDLVGKSEKNVEYCAAFEGLQYRVAARDGEFYALTMDYSPTRINVEIQKEIVTKINVG